MGVCECLPAMLHFSEIAIGCFILRAMETSFTDYTVADYIFIITSVIRYVVVRITLTSWCCPRPQTTVLPFNTNIFGQASAAKLEIYEGDVY
jgi:hypothetical protein